MKEVLVFIDRDGTIIYDDRYHLGHQKDWKRKIKIMPQAVSAIKKLLHQTNLTIQDIDVFEINEAFASQALYCVQELNISIEKVNIFGGAIALGHPLGCTGARQVATIINVMRHRKAHFGICSMCVGGGMGAAALIELI